MNYASLCFQALLWLSLWLDTHAWITTGKIPFVRLQSSVLRSSCNVQEEQVQQSAPIQTDSCCRFYLLSLRFNSQLSEGRSLSSLDIETPTYSKVLADVWRWKDAVLGDGRDYFVPRPKTLQKLGSCIQQTLPQVEECIVISNCARFEILMALRDDHPEHPLLRLEISQILLAQARCYQERVNPATKMIVSSMDWPGVIASADGLPPNNKLEPSDYDKALELQTYWTHMSDLKDIMYHLAQVACGMGFRPRRPDREVIFRPFSSRDAHILLQLKRTIQAFAPNSPQQLIRLLQWALQAGKAARDPQRVPQLNLLRPYGSGDSQKYSMQPPTQLLQNVTNAVEQIVIDPIVQECVASLVASNQASAIASFRSQCQALAQNGNELQWIKREMHQTTIQLRKGDASYEHVDYLVAEMKQRLKEKRVLE